MESKTSRLAPLVRDMLTENPDAINGSMAEEASRRLGMPVDRSEISKIRNRIGLGAFQEIERENSRRILRAYEAGKKGLPLESIWLA